MRRLGTRSVRNVQAITLALLAGTAAGPVWGGEASTATVDAAQHLLEQGQVVEAKSILVSLRKSAADGAERERVLELLSAADRRIRFLGEVELSLQKAELALKQGELRVAETHAHAAKRSDKATPEHKNRADTIVGDAVRMRDELAPMVAPTLAQAVSDFTAGRYAEAKAGFASLLRTGAALDQAQVAEVNRYQDRIYELERQNGRSFEVDYVPLSVMQNAGAATSAIASAAPSAKSGASDDQGAGDAPSSNQPMSGDSLLTDTMKIDADRLMVEAEAAFQAGRYNEAIEKFNRALTVYGAHLSGEQQSSAGDRIAEARALMGAAGTDTLGSVIEQRRVAREEAQAVFNNFLEQSRASLAKGDTQAARNLAAQARLTWNNAQANGLFGEDEYRSGLTQADALLREIDAASEEIIRSEIEERQKGLKQEEAKTRAQQEMERRQRINENLDRIRALQAEQKYDEALQVVDQVLFLDPTNPAALLLKDVLRDVQLYRDYDITRRNRGLSYVKEFNEVHRALIVPPEVMSYPADWPEISFRRGDLQSFVESEADRKVLATLESRRIPASFRDNTVEDVLAFVATVTNLNIDVDWDSLAQIGIERDKEITLELREVPARVVLERVLEKAQPDAFSRAGWAVNDGVLVVAADEALRKNTFVVIYDIRDLLFQIPDFPDAPQLDLDQVLNQGAQGGGGGGGSVFGGDTGDQEPVGPTEEELMDRILEIIQTNVDFEGWRDNGGDTGVIQELNGNLIITNTARNHREIQGVLNQLREIRSIQINVESRFLTVSTDFFEQIAFDFDVYFNADNEQFKAVNRQLEAFGVGSLANESNAVTPRDIILGTPLFQTTFGYEFTGLDATGNPQFQFDGIPYTVPRPNPLSIVPVQQNSSGLTEALTLLSGSELASTAIVGNPALGVAASYFMDDIQVDLLLEATQADRRNVTLSAPRLTFSNGRAANIAVVNQIGFISDLQPVTGTGSAAFDPTVGRLNSGVSLGVRGVASADRRYVTLTIQTAVSGRPTFRAQTITATAGGQGDNQVPQVAVGTIEIPTIDITQVNTGVTVPDKGTILLGGQRLTTELEIETGVPVLSKLPILNRFFMNRSQIKEERTLLILMKPSIIIQNEEEERNFPGLLDRLRDPFR
jgi:type II secretory pathway component GspD/PulD (secretin)/tetratricopeptide (TPR) repeat protein